jgi:cell division protein FtsB
MHDLARAVTPPRFLRSYRERAAFRRGVQRALVWSVVPLLAWAFLFADGGLAAIGVRRLRIQKLQRQVAELERRQALLEQSIARRESDPRVLERLARERYGMARPGETVYRIVEVTDEEARRVARGQRALERAAARDAAKQPSDRARRGAADPDDAGHARR